MSSTYKPVFLRALLDVGDLFDGKKSKNLIGTQWLERKDGKLLVDLNFIAVRFAKYYWDMEYSFRLRQSQHPRDANITRIIKDVHEPGTKPPTMDDLAMDDMDYFRKLVIRTSIRPQVLTHLLTNMDGLYEKVDSTTISLDDDIIEFLYTHRILLRNGINNVLGKYLEKLNHMTPQISNKIDGERTIRSVLKSSIQLQMRKWQNSECFYCKNKFKSPHVDHIIPYNFVFTTDLYNCTLACQHCNCTKSDKLPSRDLFDDVLERNREINDYFRSIDILYNEDSYIQLFETCVVEYNGDDDFFNPVL